MGDHDFGPKFGCGFWACGGPGFFSVTFFHIAIFPHFFSQTKLRWAAPLSSLIYSEEIKQRWEITISGPNSDADFGRAGGQVFSASRFFHIAIFPHFFSQTKFRWAAPLSSLIYSEEIKQRWEITISGPNSDADFGRAGGQVFSASRFFHIAIFPHFFSQTKLRWAAPLSSLIYSEEIKQRWEITISGPNSDADFGRAGGQVFSASRFFHIAIFPHFFSQTKLRWAAPLSSLIYSEEIKQRWEITISGPNSDADFGRAGGQVFSASRFFHIAIFPHFFSQTKLRWDAPLSSLIYSEEIKQRWEITISGPN